MKDKILQQKNKIIIGLIPALLLGIGYYFYLSLTKIDESSPKLDVSLFSPEIRNFYNIRNTINLDDSFMKGKNEAFFNQLKNYSQDIPLKPAEGRSNPFVPYVAP